MRRRTSTVRRACALGTTAALIALTTGLGIVTATAAHADTLETPVPTQTAPTDPTPTDAPTDPAPTDAPTAPATDDPTAPPTDAPTTPAAPAPSTAPAKPTTSKPSVTTQDAPVTPQAVDPEVTISGEAKVGQELTAKPAGFDEDLAFKYVWTDATNTVLSKVQSYTVDQTQAGKQVTVTVTGTVPGDTTTTTVSATSAVITQDPVFIGTDGKPVTDGADVDDPLFLDTTAGDPFSYTFRAQGSPAPTYKLDWFFGDEEDSSDNIVESKQQALAQADSTGIGFGFETDGDDDYTVEDQLPEGITFDPSTGELSGTATLASYYDFAITATSGDVSTTQYVELTVDHAAAFGITAFTLDEKSITAADKRIWLIQPDGSIYTVDVKSDEDGFPEELTLTPTGRPTVAQGGTLVVSGSPVDRFGNDATDFDDDGNPTFVPTVTSDVASDVVAPYEENGAEGQGVYGVTFPHASVHTITVASGTLQPVAFAVDVQPTVAPVAIVTPVTPVVTTGQLAYTGSDATSALPWALALVLAGAGLIGARTLRRRHAQR